MNDNHDEIYVEEFEEGGVSLNTDVEEQAEQLLEVESQLQTVDGAAVDPESVYESGVIVGAERIPNSDVPESYPEPFHTPNALKLDVRLGPDREASVYLDWPEQLSEETPLYRLLRTLDISPHSFADILGSEILLERDGHYYVLFFPDDISHKFPYLHYVIGALLVSWSILWIPGQQVPTKDITYIIWMLLPIVVYIDTEYVRARSTWTPHTWLWPALSFILIANIPAGVVYLYKRHQAEFLYEQPSGRIETVLGSIKEWAGL